MSASIKPLHEAIRRASEPDTQWKAQLPERAAAVFSTAASRKEQLPDLKTLHAKIGQLTLENDFLSGKLTRMDDVSAKK